MPCVRVHLIDPSGDVLPYDHALAAALARQGVDVELVTSRFVHGPAPEPDGYDVSESFYRLATRLGEHSPRRRRAVKLAEHVPDMLRYRRRADAADVRHFQWLPVERIDSYLLPAARPRVLTMHNVIRREAVDLRLAERMDAVVVHTRHGAELLGGGERVHVIPHGAFEHLTRQPPRGAAARRARRGRAPGGPVLRRDPAVQGSGRAGRGVPPGRGRGAVGGRAAARGVDGAPAPARASGRVRFVDRYVSDAELPAFFRRADVLVLPHRSVDVSGVLFAGLAFGKAMVLSDVGGFREIAEEHGAGVLVPPEDPDELAAAIARLLADDAERRRLEERALAAAAGPFSWDRIAAQTASLYEQVRREGRVHGEGKRSAARALEWLRGRGRRRRGGRGGRARRVHARRAARGPRGRAARAAARVRRRSCTRSPPDDVDLVVSFLFWKRIREPLLSLGRIGCLNFHPAPLPDMRGVGGYNVAVLEGMGEWGVSCHFVDADFDTGDIVEVERFPIDPDTATALSVDLDSQEHLYGLFQRVMRRVLAGEELPRTPQGEGRYVSREEFEELRRVRPGDDLDRKLRAFWYPPHPGAVVEVDGRELTLVDEALLAELGAASTARPGWVP